MTTTQEAMRRLFRVQSGINQLRLPGVFPDYQALSLSQTPLLRRNMALAGSWFYRRAHVHAPVSHPFGPFLPLSRPKLPRARSGGPPTPGVRAQAPTHWQTPDRFLGPASLGLVNVTAPRSPWQNAYVERLIGSIRRECLDYTIIFNERHLRRVLSSYVDYYHRSQTHLALAKDCPEGRPTQSPDAGKMIAIL